MRDHHANQRLSPCPERDHAHDAADVGPSVEEVESTASASSWNAEAAESSLAYWIEELASNASSSSIELLPEEGEDWTLQGEENYQEVLIAGEEGNTNQEGALLTKTGSSIATTAHFMPPSGRSSAEPPVSPSHHHAYQDEPRALRHDSDFWIEGGRERGAVAAAAAAVEYRCHCRPGVDPEFGPGASSDLGAAAGRCEHKESEALPTKGLSRWWPQRGELAEAFWPEDGSGSCGNWLPCVVIELKTGRRCWSPARVEEEEEVFSGGLVEVSWDEDGSRSLLPFNMVRPRRSNTEDEAIIISSASPPTVSSAVLVSSAVEQQPGASSGEDIGCRSKDTSPLATATLKVGDQVEAFWPDNDEVGGGGQWLLAEVAAGLPRFPPSANSSSVVTVTWLEDGSVSELPYEYVRQRAAGAQAPLAASEGALVQFRERDQVESSGVRFARGAEVLVSGVVTRPELNGEVAIFLGPASKPGRCSVLFTGTAETLSINERNLTKYE